LNGLCHQAASARVPLALSRFTYGLEREQVPSACTNPYDHARYTEKMTPHELITRLITHTLDRWVQAMKYFGFDTTRNRGKKRFLVNIA